MLTGKKMREAIPMRMTIKTRWRSVCCPSSVCNSGMGIIDFSHVRCRLGDQILELGDLAYFLESENLIFGVPIDGKAGGIISSCDLISVIPH